MKILSNDYLSNLPKSSHVSHGGTANFAYHFSTYTADQGHEWIGVMNALNDQPTPRIQKKATIPGRTYYQFSYLYAHSRSFLSLKKKVDPREWFAPQIKCLRQFIRRHKPDVLFLNGFPMYGWLLLEAAAQEHLPIVIQHAGIAQVEFEQYKHLYSTAARAMLLDMERDIVSVGAKQIFLNAYSQGVFAKKVAPSSKKQSIIIPLPYLQAFADGILHNQTQNTIKKSKKIVVGCVARWDRIKNLKAVLVLAKEAKQKNLPWTFKSVTTIPQTPIQIRFKEAYKREIEVVAPMPQLDLIPFYQSLDLLILPSHFDVSPTVVMEGALVGKQTLISPSVGWVSEYQACGLDDLIIDFSDPRQVIKRIQKILKQKPSVRFRNLVQKKHAPKQVFAAYLEVFSSVL